MPTRPIKVWDGTAWIDVGVTAPSTTGFALTANNLSDLASASTALSNLGGTPTSRTITAGTGLTGGGDLSANRTVSIAAGGVGTTELAAGAVTAAKLDTLPYSVEVSAWQLPTSASATPAGGYQAVSAYNGSVYVVGQNCFMEWTIWCAAGTYTLRTIYMKQSNGGIYALSIDGGAALGTTIDSYNSTTTRNNVTDITGIVLTAGRHTVRYTSSTKNASSNGYVIELHGLSLTRTGA